MSSSKGDSEKSEKQQVWELEEQLEDEQHAHKKTKFTLRKVQEELEEMRMDLNAAKKLQYLDEVHQNDHLKAVMSENENLKNQLRMKDSKEQVKKVEELERDNHSLRIEISYLKTSYEENVESMSKLNDNLAKMKNELERQMENLMEAEEELNKAKVEKEKLKEELERMKQTSKEQMKVIEEIKELKGNLQCEKDDLKIEMDKQSEKLEDYETRLEEYKEEVNRLTMTKKETILGCRYWSDKCKDNINRLISVSRYRISEKDEEDFKKLKEFSMKAFDESEWWSQYFLFIRIQSEIFNLIQEMRANPDSQTSLNRSQKMFSCNKVNINAISMYLEKNKGRNEWFKHELYSEHIVTLERLVKEAEERINKP